MIHRRTLWFFMAFILLFVTGCTQAAEQPAQAAPTETAEQTAPAEATAPAPQEGQTEAPKELTTVTMAFTSAQPYLGHTTYFVAQELGYWAEEGLDVQFEWTSGSSQAIQLLTAKQIDFTAANHDTLIFAIDKGAALKAVFQEHTKCEFVFAVPKDSPIQTIEDMQGKRIGVSSLSSGFVSFAKAAFFEAGLDHENINFVEVGSGATAATAISAGEIDVLGLWEVAFATLENTLGADYFNYIKPPIYDRLACNAVITSDALIENNPDVVTGFLRGLAKATLFMQTNPDAAIDIFYAAVPEAKPQGQDAATILAEARHVIDSENLQRSNKNRPEANPDQLWGFVVESELIEAQEVNIMMGMLANRLEADKMLTNEFVEPLNDFDSDAIIQQAQSYGS